MSANNTTAEQAQQWWQQNGHLTTHTGGGPQIDFGPTSPGWVATTACNNTPYQYPLTAEPTTTTVTDPGMPSTGACPACGCTIVGAHLGGCPVRDVYAGHSRVQWFENLTEEQRKRIVECAPNPWIDQNAKIAWFGSPLLRTAPVLSDADVERIARRAAEIVVELLAAREAKP